MVPTASPFLVRQLAAGLYQPLDKAKLKNWGNLDPDDHGGSSPSTIPATPTPSRWMWGTIGIGYNVAEIKKRMPDAPVDSLAMVFDPGGRRAGSRIAAS